MKLLSLGKQFEGVLVRCGERKLVRYRLLKYLINMSVQASCCPAYMRDRVAFVSIRIACRY
jgi:hypothetical protein